MKEEIKQRIVAKVEKIKRFNRINQYQQNRLFQSNQHSFYQELNNKRQQEKREGPYQREANKFWSAIWSRSRI